MDNFEELLKNPKKYRTGDNYEAANIVFPVEFEGKKYVAKKQRLFSFWVNAYHVLQDKFAFKTQKLSFNGSRLRSEVMKLKRLHGLKVPELIAYDDGCLIREFLEGTEFKGLKTEQEKAKTLEEALQAMALIHGRVVIIGDARVENTIRCKDGTYWLDFDGKYTEFPLERARAADRLKFVFSVYSTTEDSDLTAYSLELAFKKCPDEAVSSAMKGLLNDFYRGAKACFSAEIPSDKKIIKEIRKFLD